MHAYVSIPGGKTCYLSELQAGKEVVVVDRNGKQRNAIVGRVKIESRPLILVEVKVCTITLDGPHSYSCIENFKCSCVHEKLCYSL